MKYYTRSVDEIIEMFDTHVESWLSDTQVLARRKKYGTNTLPQKKKTSIVMMFLSQLNDWLIYILLLAVIVTASMGHFMDAGIILGVICINAFLWVFQEYKADKAIEALKNMSAPHALVKRNNKVVEIDSREVVPWDIVILDAGRIMTADVRLIGSQELQIEESALTGESVPSKKSSDFSSDDPNLVIGDRHNMAYMSTVVTAGRGIGIVVATGGSTEVWHIANILDTEAVMTPLELRLEHLGKTLWKIAIAICALMFLVGYLQWRELSEMFLLSVSLAVASIPEWLAAIVAVVLSIGVTQMSRRNAIIKRLPAVETLWSVDTICSDKTGTLTQNRMTVTEVYHNHAHTYITPEANYGDTDKLLACAMVLSSDATYEDGVGTGDPTEIALLRLADDMWVDRRVLARENQRITEIPFDSDRKLMSTLIKNANEYTVYTKGAMDNILQISTHVLKDGAVVPFSQEEKQQYLDAMRASSDKALRTLGVAYKDTDTTITKEQMESGLVFIGYVGMIDPPRTQVKSAIQQAKWAGITAIMITGDYLNTAFAIAKELDIAQDISQAISWKEIDALWDEEFETMVLQYHVFARVSPEHKVRIVKALRSHGRIVSMTGDGVNDAPSLSAADIGVAMGITGTDVAKGAADMILTDDNFSTIVSAVEQWRNIYNNIKTSVLFLLSCNLWEVIAMFIVLLIGWKSPLIAIQLLWINLVTDSFPAIALGMQKGDASVMNESPRKPHESFFSHGAGIRTLIFWTLMGSATIAAFWYGYHASGYSPFDTNTPDSVLIYARTLAFITLVLTQLFFTLSIQSEHYTVFSHKSWNNPYLIGSIFVALGLQVFLIYNTFMSQAFHVTSLSIDDWKMPLILAIIPLIINEIRKYFIISHFKKPTE